jgi:hypothetical protein
MPPDHYLSSSQEFATLEQRVTALEQSHTSLRADLAANTTMTTAVKADTAALVEFTNAMRGFATFCRWIGRGLRFIGMYLAPIALVAVTVWSSLKGNGQK